MTSMAGGALVRGYIDGCFDIMHSGHYNAIRQAKQICDVLVVGIHSDDEISENKALPVMRQNERYSLLEHIKWIDEIVYDVPYSPLLSTLELARADFCIHGDDMPVNAQGFCAYDEMRVAGKLRIIKRTEGVSTTDLIGRLLTLAKAQEKSLASYFGDAGIGSTGVSGAEMVKRRNPSECSDDVYSLLGMPTTPSVEAKLVCELALKYHMSPDDIARLKAAFPKQSFEELQSPTEESFRTTIPVQLLTSTRRIMEFASSKEPQVTDRVVYVSGCFDMFHVGHAQFLKDARALGTFLLVGVYDDAAISRSRGPHLPVMNLTERVLNVCACKWADEVVIGAPLEVTHDLVKTWNIRVVARGIGHKRSTGDDMSSTKDTVPKELGLYAEITSKWPDLCHETIVQRIMQSREAYISRNRVRAKREDEYYTQKEGGK